MRAISVLCNPIQPPALPHQGAAPEQHRGLQGRAHMDGHNPNRPHRRRFLGRRILGEIPLHRHTLHRVSNRNLAAAAAAAPLYIFS